MGHGQIEFQVFSGGGGRLYASRAGSNIRDIVEISPTTGALLRDDVGSTALCAFGLATDPLTSDLFISDFCFTGGNTEVPRVLGAHGPTPSTVVYASAPATPNGQLVFAPSGTLFVPSGNVVVRVAGTNQPQPLALQSLALTQTNPAPFGLQIGSKDANAAPFSLVGSIGTSTQFGSLKSVGVLDLASTPLGNGSPILTGDPGTLLFGPDGCLFAAHQDAVYRVTNADGSCNPFGATATGPTLTLLSPITAIPAPAQGTQRTLNARVGLRAPQAGIPVLFTVSGANSEQMLAYTNAAGVASASYRGLVAGNDFIVADATIGNDQIASNRARITWTPSIRPSVLDHVDGDPGALGTIVPIRALLRDGTDGTAISGQTIGFVLGTLTCSGTTDVDGIAGCSFPVRVQGRCMLTASYAGNISFEAANASTIFRSYALPIGSSQFASGFEDCPGSP